MAGAINHPWDSSEAVSTAVIPPNGADGEINAAGQDDQGHPQGNNSDEREIAGDVDDVSPLPELRNGDGEHQQHDDQGRQAADLPDGQDPRSGRRADFLVGGCDLGVHSSVLFESADGAGQARGERTCHVYPCYLVLFRKGTKQQV
jgi:hypothetical protein